MKIALIIILLCFIFFVIGYVAGWDEEKDDLKK